MEKKDEKRKGFNVNVKTDLNINENVKVVFNNIVNLVDKHADKAVILAALAMIPNDLKRDIVRAVVRKLI